MPLILIPCDTSVTSCAIPVTPCDMQTTIAQPGVDFANLNLSDTDPLPAVVMFTETLKHRPDQIGTWTTFVEGGTSDYIYSLYICIICTYRLKHRPDQIGTWTTFVEGGTFK
jgi:hypothetical protein